MSANNAEVLEEICKLNSKFDIGNIERQWWISVQYARRECSEVVSIPKEVEQNDLKGKMLSVLENVGCKIEPDNMEDCHRLSKNSDYAVIKFLGERTVNMFFGLKGIYKILTWRILVFMGKTKFI